jgi:DNA-directed RNA polymerase specialized sigma24 family protein
MPWVFGIAAHRAVDAHRHRRANEMVEDGELAAANDAPPPVFEMLSWLPVAHQEVLLLRYLVGFSEAETAVALGVRVGTVKSRTARAAQTLRLAFSEEVKTR